MLNMEKHLRKRPSKKVFQVKEIERLRSKAIEKIKAKFLPDSKIIKIIMIGSAVRNSFGMYKSPGFRGSLYSDFDFIIFVEDNYEIPKWLDKELTGKAFQDDELNLAHRQKGFIENKYDVEIFFIRRKDMKNPEIQKLGEVAGIPMTEKSKHKHLIVYSKK